MLSVFRRFVGASVEKIRLYSHCTLIVKGKKSCFFSRVRRVFGVKKYVSAVVQRWHREIILKLCGYSAVIQGNN